MFISQRPKFSACRRGISVIGALTPPRMVEVGKAGVTACGDGIPDAHITVISISKKYGGQVKRATMGCSDRLRLSRRFVIIRDTTGSFEHRRCLWALATPLRPGDGDKCHYRSLEPS